MTLAPRPMSLGMLGAAMAAILCGSAHADVTMEERMSINGVGMMKMANMSGTTTTMVARDRARTDSNLQFESGMMRALARGVGKSSDIVRLDQDKVYSLNTEKKTYTETTFAEQRAQMQQAMEQMRKSQASQQQATSGVDTSECEWSEPKGEVLRSGEKAAIAGYQAERITITATQTCTDKKSGQACDFGLVLDQWLAPGFEAQDEMLDYSRAYAEKLGLNASGSRDFAERAESLFGGYTGIWKEVAAKMRDVKGYPVRSSFALGVGGPQCKSTQEAQAAGGPPSPPSIGDAIGGALGGVFKRKKEPAPAAPTTPPPEFPGGLMTLMSVSTELVSVKTGAVDPQAFEIPTGFKQVKD